MMTEQPPGGQVCPAGSEERTGNTPPTVTPSAAVPLLQRLFSPVIRRGPETKPAGWCGAEAEEQDSQRVWPEGAVGPRGLPSKLPLSAHRDGSTQPASCPGPRKLLGEPLSLGSLAWTPAAAGTLSRTEPACLHASPLHISRTHRFCLRSFQQPPPSSSLGLRAVLGPLHSPWTWLGVHRHPRLGSQPCWTVGSQIACPCSQLLQKNRRDGWSLRSPAGWLMDRPCQPFAALLYHLQLPAPSRMRPEEDAKGNFRDLASTQNYKEHSACAHLPDSFQRPLYQAR